jgi:hypothetical protein
MPNAVPRNEVPLGDPPTTPLVPHLGCPLECLKRHAHQVAVDALRSRHACLRCERRARRGCVLLGPGSRWGGRREIRGHAACACLSGASHGMGHAWAMHGAPLQGQVVLFQVGHTTRVMQPPSSRLAPMRAVHAIESAPGLAVSMPPRVRPPLSRERRSRKRGGVREHGTE